MASDRPSSKGPVRHDSATGRWIVAGAVLGSGAAFLEGTAVNVALPAIARDFGLGVEGLQWVVNGYLLTLSALMLLGGSLGDQYRRSRVFTVGCVGFAAASLGCALAPTLPALVILRLLQGTAGALLVPNSLAVLETSFQGDERGAAIGQWTAWSAISTALGPLAGGLAGRRGIVALGLRERRAVRAGRRVDRHAARAGRRDTARPPAWWRAPTGHPGRGAGDARTGRCRRSADRGPGLGRRASWPCSAPASAASLCWPRSCSRNAASGGRTPNRSSRSTFSARASSPVRT